ncbi:MAG: serine O-acetyltransferase [Candidatus Korobacteraceae bacterium]
MSAEDMKCLAQEFRADLDAQLAGDESSEFNLPTREAVATLCRRYLEILFPIYYLSGEREVPGALACHHLIEIQTLLAQQICSAVRFECRRSGKLIPSDLEHYAEDAHKSLFMQLPELARLLSTDIDAAYHNDPSASSVEEILLAYPFIEPVTVQRLAHRLYLLDVPFIPRMMTEIAHSHTGIDIHPGASIGESFFIDHGTGVVIGETSIIGNKVTLYHGVTLGAFNPLSKDENGQLRRGQGNKRHPTIEDHVTVYPNATILGGNTHIGHHSVIGGNVWLTHSVAPYSRVTVEDPELHIFNAGDHAWGLYDGI